MFKIFSHFRKKTKTIEYLSMNTFPLAIQNNPNKGTYFNVCFATQTVRFGNSKFEKKIIWKWVKTTKQMEF